MTTTGQVTSGIYLDTVIPGPNPDDLKDEEKDVYIKRMLATDWSPATSSRSGTERGTTTGTSGTVDVETFGAHSQDVKEDEPGSGAGDRDRDWMGWMDDGSHGDSVSPRNLDRENGENGASLLVVYRFAEVV